MYSKIFSGIDFSDYKQTLLNQIEEKVKLEDDVYLLNVNNSEYENFLFEEFSIQPLQIHFDQMRVSAFEKMIKAEEFPRDRFDPEPGKSYSKQVITYHIPFSGDKNMLYVRPSPRLLSGSNQIQTNNEEIYFDIVDFYGDVERIKSEAARYTEVVQQQLQYLQKNIEDYNRELLFQIKKIVDLRKARIAKQNQIVASLGVPVLVNTNSPLTFSVPASARKSIILKPGASTGSYQPEPSLEVSIYEEILNTIHDTGRSFERLPSVYAGKDEMSLRDHFIVNLEPRFQIATTGETFNKSGKTDILMRWEGKNIFVAECKFWSGQKNHIDTINQILGYLTWRDSKTAIIYFISNKDISSVLKTIEETTPTHPCFMKFVKKVDDSRFSYEFHIIDDVGRPIILNILCFHLPK